MKNVWLNGRKMMTTKGTHYYLKRKLNLPEYYGANLDALWDILSTVSEPLQVTLLFPDQLEKNLGCYSGDLIQVFKDAEKVNSNLIFRV